MKKVARYEGDIPKLSVSNSLVVDGVIFYIAKKNYDGKVVNLFVAYDYKSKAMLIALPDKEQLVLWLKNNIEKIKKRLEKFNG
jgi:hypothetical protein